jgi:hypothetical protein
MNNKTAATMNYLDVTSLSSAQDNMNTIITGQRESHRYFIVMAVAVYQIREHKQYKALGYKSVSAFLDTQDINMSKSKYDELAMLGNALAYLYVEEAGLIACGSSSCIQIARLAKTKDDAQANAKLIASLISRRGNGTIDNAKVRDEVTEALGLTKPTEETEETEESAAETWKTKYLKALGSAADEAAFIAMLGSLKGE